MCRRSFRAQKGCPVRTVSHEGCVCGSVFRTVGVGEGSRGSCRCEGAIDVGQVMILVGTLLAMGVKLTSVAILVSLE